MRVLVLAAVFLSAWVPLHHGACPYEAPETWADYDGPETELDCSSESFSAWWRRDTKALGGVRSGGNCELVEEEWQPFEDCSDEVCRVGVDSSTVSLEYCCTGGANPAAAATSGSQLKCFTLTVCPLITSVGIPPRKLFAGSQASVYLSLGADPIASFDSPLISHTLNPNEPDTLLPFESSHHSEFLDTTVAYMFTVPEEGRVNVWLHTVILKGGGCGSSLTEDYRNEYRLEVVQGETLSTLPPLPPSPTPTADTTDSSPPTTPTVPPSSPPSCSTLADTPPHTPPSVPGTFTESKDSPETEVILAMVCVLGVLVVVLVVALVMVCVWAMKLKRQSKMMFNPSRKTSIESTSTDVTGAGFINPLPPSSPPPPPPLDSSPMSHHIISADHEPSSDPDAIVTAPSPSQPSSSDNKEYSMPIRNKSRDNGTGTGHVTSTAHSPHRTRTAALVQCTMCHSGRDHSGSGTDQPCHCGTDRPCHSGGDHSGSGTDQPCHCGTDRLCHSGRDWFTMDHCGTDQPDHRGGGGDSSTLGYGVRESPTPSHSGTEQSTPLHCGPDHHHTSRSHHYHSHQNGGQYQYTFIDGEMFTRRDRQVLHLKSSLNIGPTSRV